MIWLKALGMVAARLLLCCGVFAAVWYGPNWMRVTLLVLWFFFGLWWIKKGLED